MKYYFKVWLFTILLSPLLILVELAFKNTFSLNDFFQGFVPLWFYAVMLGSAFALPSLFLFYLLNKDLSTSHLPVYLKKMIHAIVGLILLWGTFFIIDPQIFKNIDGTLRAWAIAYSITLAIGIFIFKITEKEISE